MTIMKAKENIGARVQIKRPLWLVVWQ